MIDKNIGLKYQDCFCQECKTKIADYMKTLSAWKLIRQGNKVYSKAAALLCNKCKSKLLKRMGYKK